MNNTGTLVQIIGAVVDADFSRSETLPALLNALEVDYEINGQRKTLVLEVQQHIGDGWVRAVAMSSTDGLRRGMPVRDLGHPIEVPVGPCVLGRIFNVLGEAVDERGKPDCAGVRSIHRSAPPLDEQSTSTGGTGNGHQGDRPDLPLPERRQGRRVRRCRRGQDRAHHGADQQHRQGA